MKAFLTRILHWPLLAFQGDFYVLKKLAVTVIFVLYLHSDLIIINFWPKWLKL